MMTTRPAKLAILALLCTCTLMVGCASRGGSQSTGSAPAATESKPAAATAQAVPAAPAAPAAKPAAQAYTGKVLVLAGPLPGDVAHDVVGQVEVFSRSYGGIAESYRLLGEKGREVGANAIIESRVWLAPSFPVAAAPHGRGTAVRVKDTRRLEALGGSGGRWE